MKESEQDAYKEYNVDEEFVIEWMAKHQNDQYIQDRFSKLQEIH